MKDDEKNALIEHRIARATDTIEEVSFLIKNKKFLLAVNRIYYGMFYILSALSLKYDFSTSKHQNRLVGSTRNSFPPVRLTENMAGYCTMLITIGLQEIMMILQSLTRRMSRSPSMK